LVQIYLHHPQHSFQRTIQVDFAAKIYSAQKPNLTHQLNHQSRIMPFLIGLLGFLPLELELAVLSKVPPFSFVMLQSQVHMPLVCLPFTDHSKIKRL